MSGFASILDEDGNVNSNKLTKELKGALEFDIRYKQTDNMKKRAIRTAGSYDEFKAMVACAHLKKLSKKEVESLSHVKRGWQRGPTGTTGASACAVLDLEREQEQLARLNIGERTAKLINPETKIRSCMELERDLRRLSNDLDKYELLSKLGAKSTVSLLKKGADVDLIEEVLRILIFCYPLSKGKTSETAVDKSAEHNGAENLTPDADSSATSQSVPDVTATAQDSALGTAELTAPLAEATSLSTWLSKLSSLEKFDLMLRFANKELIDSVRQRLQIERVTPTVKGKFSL